MMHVGHRSLAAVRKARSTRKRIWSGLIAVWTYSLATSLKRVWRSTSCWYEPPIAVRRGLPDDRDDRLVVHLRVVEAVEEVDGPGARGRQADADLARELRVAASHEGGHLFVARLDEAAATVVAVERAHDAVDAVARISEDVA